MKLKVFLTEDDLKEKKFNIVTDAIIITKKFNLDEFKNKKLVDINTDISATLYLHEQFKTKNDEIISFNPLIKIIGYNVFSFNINPYMRGLQIVYNHHKEKLTDIDYIDNIKSKISETFTFDLDIYNRNVIIDKVPGMTFKRYTPIINVYFPKEYYIIESNKVYDDPYMYITFEE